MSMSHDLKKGALRHLYILLHGHPFKFSMNSCRLGLYNALPKDIPSGKPRTSRGDGTRNLQDFSYILAASEPIHAFLVFF